MESLEQRKFIRHKLNTLAELCLLLGYGLIIFSTLLSFFRRSLSALAIGMIFCIMRYLSTHFLAEKEKRGWAIQEIIGVSGFTLVPIGLWFKTWIVVAFGALLFVTLKLPRPVKIVRKETPEAGRCFRKSYGEIAEQVKR